MVYGCVHCYRLLWWVICTISMDIQNSTKRYRSLVLVSSYAQLVISCRAMIIEFHLALLDYYFRLPSSRWYWCSARIIVSTYFLSRSILEQLNKEILILGVVIVLVVAVLSSLSYSKVWETVIRNCPHCFTYGEALLVAQAIVLYLSSFGINVVLLWSRPYVKRCDEIATFILQVRTINLVNWDFSFSKYCWSYTLLSLSTFDEIM